MGKIKYVLGLDVGVGSIGYGLLLLNDEDSPIRILDQGVVVFKALDNTKTGKTLNEARRNHRGTRRIYRRRKEKIKTLKRYLLSKGILSERSLKSLYDEKSNETVYDLKLKGLYEKLSNDELAKVMIHYIKHRGFQSNRKSTSTEEKGKMKAAISDIQKIMERDSVTVTRALHIYKEEKNIAFIRNKAEHYYYGFERKDVEDEINQLLDKQIECHVINQSFKEGYLEIWSSQRDYSEGPSNSKYSVSFDNTFGNCKFRPKEKRIARAAPSFEFFVLLQKLHDLRYFYRDEEGNKIFEDKKVKTVSLTPKQIQIIFGDAKKGKKITYKYIKKLIGEEHIDFVDMPKASKKEFIKELDEYKKKHQIEGKLSKEQYAELLQIMKIKNFDKELYTLHSYNKIRSQIKKHSDNYKQYIDDIDFLDAAGTVLTFAKTDNAIDKTIAKYYPAFDKEKIALIKKIDNKITGSGSICLSLIKELNAEMLAGKDYTEAMVKLKLDHALQTSNVVFDSIFPTVKEIEEKYDTIITQPNVKHILVILRKLYTQIVKQYGIPYNVNIELARDIRNGYLERQNIRKAQIENKVENQEARLELAQLVGIDTLKGRSYPSFSSDDIMKFRLWKEQKGICLYTGEVIEKEYLLQRGYCEVDHIQPFSRTFDDSFQNKALVMKKANQEKLNRTPYEWLGKHKELWNAFVNRINDIDTLHRNKKEKLLSKEDINYDEFTRQSLHATSYASKLILRIFKDLLKTDEDSQKVKSFKGGITNYLRFNYQLNNCTHSMESNDYRRDNTIYKIADNIDVHHDEVVNKSYIKITAFNQYQHELEYTLRVNAAKIKGEHGKETFRFFRTEDAELYHLIALQKQELLDCFSQKKLYEKSLVEIDDKEILDNVKDYHIVSVVMKLIQGLKADLNEKNRNNHFHHIVDALLIASMTNSVQQKITKFHQLLQMVRNHDQKKILTEDPDTGEILSWEKMKQDYHLDTNSSINKKYIIPRPYTEFIDELIVRVFERDEHTLHQELSKLSNYTPEIIAETHVKYPYLYVDKKVSGPLHEETIYGMKQDTSLKQMVATNRKSIDDLKEADLEKLYDKEQGQKEVHEVLTRWFKNHKKTKPMLKNGHEIKKVKLVDENIQKLIEISQKEKSKGYAGIGDIARIEIYKKEDSDKLYFVQIPIAFYTRMKKQDYHFNVTVWEAPGKGFSLYIPYTQLQTEFQLYKRLYPGQLIYVELQKNIQAYCLVVGFSSGLLELRSVLGDGIDFIHHRFMSKVQRCQKSISTIKDIQYVNIDMLGNIKCRTDNY